MPYHVKLEQFQGPFDLLLQLIEQEKLNINEISLAKVTEQYIKSLQNVEELYPEELADFLVVATKLLLIKSRTLLPYLQVDDEEDKTNLEEQLKIYKEFHEASLKLEEIIKAGNYTYGRVDSRYVSPEVIFAPPQDFTAQDLKQFYQEVLTALEPIIQLPQAAISRAITLKEKILQLQTHLTKQAQLSFKEIVKSAENKTDVIVTFLALLELVKQEFISVRQENNFEDIKIMRTRQETRPLGKN